MRSGRVLGVVLEAIFPRWAFERISWCVSELPRVQFASKSWESGRMLGFGGVWTGSGMGSRRALDGVWTGCGRGAGGWARGVPSPAP